MAVEQDSAKVIEPITFDGDWPKAAAIDAALTYGIFAVEEVRRQIERQVSGRQPINSRTLTFTVITSAFLEVLHQHGYQVISIRELEDLTKGVEKLSERISQCTSANDQLGQQLDVQDDEIARLRDLVRDKDAEIASLKETQQAEQTLVVSECTEPAPYNPNNGDPCTKHTSDPDNRSLHMSGSQPGKRPEERWHPKEGLVKEQARQLKTRSQYNDR